MATGIRTTVRTLRDHSIVARCPVKEGEGLSTASDDKEGDGSVGARRAAERHPSEERGGVVERACRDTRRLGQG